jgi:G-protein pathway suppressor 2-interacting domain
MGTDLSRCGIEFLCFTRLRICFQIGPDYTSTSNNVIRNEQDLILLFVNSMEEQQQHMESQDNDLGVSPMYKKIRLGNADSNKQQMQVKSETQPLKLDITVIQFSIVQTQCIQFFVLKEPAYNPQVEAISPTLPVEIVQEDVTFRATKDGLLQQIAQVDREIAKAESQIIKLKKKQASALLLNSVKFLLIEVEILERA